MLSEMLFSIGIQALNITLHFYMNKELWMNKTDKSFVLPLIPLEHQN